MRGVKQLIDEWLMQIGLLREKARDMKIRRLLGNVERDLLDVRSRIKDDGKL